VKFSVGQEVTIVKYIRLGSPAPDMEKLYRSYVGQRAKIIGIAPLKNYYQLDIRNTEFATGICWREDELEDPFIAVCQEALDNPPEVLVESKEPQQV
jgi:hypothetical protein